MRPARFVIVKLLTERAHKGAEDKLQALLVLAERGEDQAFEAEVGRLLAAVDPERLADVRAAAQAAVFSLQRDPTSSEGYELMRHQVEVGFSRLTALLERLDA